MLRQHL